MRERLARRARRQRRPPLRFLTVREVSALLRLGERAVREGLIRGEIPGNKVGGVWRIEAYALARWADGRAP